MKLKTCPNCNGSKTVWVSFYEFNKAKGIYEDHGKYKQCPECKGKGHIEVKDD